MEIGDGSGESVASNYNYSKSELAFLRRTLTEELADDRSNRERLVIAVHAVLLESGFAVIEPITGKHSDDDDGPYLLDKWSTLDQTMWLYYTLPQILKNRSSNIIDNLNMIEEGEGFVLRIQGRGQRVNVYGCLTSSGSGPYRPCRHVRLDEETYGPVVKFLWENRHVDYRDGDLYTIGKADIFQLWKTVKDEIVLPMLIELCPKAGLPAPTNFMDLPSEVRMKILEAMPGVNIAKVACVCKELKSLASDDDELWMLKFAEFWISCNAKEGQGNMMETWKSRFGRRWKTLRDQEKRLFGIIWN